MLLTVTTIGMLPLIFFCSPMAKHVEILLWMSFSKKKKKNLPETLDFVVFLFFLCFVFETETFLLAFSFFKKP